VRDRRVVFDFEIAFANGGGIQGQEFRLDIEEEGISDQELADYIVEDLRLLMVSRIEILNKHYINEPHKRTGPALSEGPAIVDLSHPIRDGMITYPGLPGPTIGTHLSRAESRSHYAEGTEFYIGSVEMVANTGTYIDTPFHRYPDGHDIASLPLDRIVAVPGVVVDATERNIRPETFDDTETWGRAVLIRTGWAVHFGQDDYVGDHPHLTEAAAQRLIDGGAVLVGIDSANIDDTTGSERPVHSLLLANQIPIVEHLTRLDQLPTTAFQFYAIPPPIVGVGTFPIRAIARWR
jgi:kynurenine formamidase